MMRRGDGLSDVNLNFVFDREDCTIRDFGLQTLPLVLKFVMGFKKKFKEIIISAVVYGPSDN